MEIASVKKCNAKKCVLRRGSAKQIFTRKRNAEKCFLRHDSSQKCSTRKRNSQNRSIRRGNSKKCGYSLDVLHIAWDILSWHVISFSTGI